VEAAGHTANGGTSFESLITLLDQARVSAAAAERRAHEYATPDGDVQRQRRKVESKVQEAAEAATAAAADAAHLCVGGRE